MVSSRKIKSLDFDTIGEYFDYVIESYRNGQLAQMKGLFKDLSKDQRSEFLDYLVNSGETDNTKQEIFKRVATI